MGTTANPMYNYAVAGQNPTGSQIANPLAPSQTTSGMNPYLLPYSGTSGTSAVPGTSSTQFAANTAGAPATGTPGGSLGSTGSSSSTPFAPTGVAQGLGFGTTTSSQHQMYQNLEKTYGSGIAGAIMQFLANGAGYNQNAVNDMIAAMQPGFSQNQQNLLTSFSGGGNRFGSGAQYGLSNLQSQQQLNVGELESQMYEQAVQNYISTLMGAAGNTAQRISGSPSTLDTIGSALSLGSDAASALSNAGVGGAVTGAISML